MATYRDLRSFLGALEARGKLYRFRGPIDKDSELLPFFRVQLRGLPADERKVMLFDQVTNAAGERYEARVVAGVYGMTEEIIALGIDCESPQEALERWHQALEHPIPPRIVASGPVQEVVQTGDELQRVGLDMLPAPLEEPGYTQILRTGLPMITQDPESGVRNVGAYNGFLRDRTRMVANIGDVHDAMKYHWAKAKERGEDLPIAIVVGPAPHEMLATCAVVPYGVDELAIAGGLAGEPIELVQCKTIPLAVPAHAEMIIEGYLSTSVFEPRLGFGEYPGYISKEDSKRPIITVTGITHRRNPVFTAVLVGFPPSDNNTLSAFVNSAMVYQTLRYEAGLPLDDVYFYETSGGADFGVLRLAPDAGAQAGAVLEATAKLLRRPKFLIAVDHDVDPRDPDLVIWALSYRVHPEHDVRVVGGRAAGLDPITGHRHPADGEAPGGGRRREASRVLIDATLKGPYPPVALPRRDFMERALDLWRRQGDLPEPRLRQPWHGYELGVWSQDDQELADLLIRGDYKAVGRITKEFQERI
jgi:UbiD family decarboxylase